MLTAKIKLRDSDASIKRKVYAVLIRRIRARYSNLSEILILKFNTIFLEELLKSDTYRAMMTGGELAGDFGFEMGKEDAYVLPILYTWLKQHKVLKKEQFHDKGGVLYGMVRVGFIEMNFAAVFDLPLSSYVVYNEHTKKWGYVPWLRWLLLGGDSIDTDYKFYRKDGYGRSGQGVMIKNSPAWKINPRYSGTASFNWVHKIINDVRDRLRKELIQDLKMKARVG